MAARDLADQPGHVTGAEGTGRSRLPAGDAHVLGGAPSSGRGVSVASARRDPVGKVFLFFFAPSVRLTDQNSERPAQLSKPPSSVEAITQTGQAVFVPCWRPSVVIQKERPASRD